jgi:hypothetical protein
MGLAQNVMVPEWSLNQMISNNDLTADTAKSVKELMESGGDPKEYYWPFNGLKPNGELFSMDMATFVSWASALHPEYLDEETGQPLLYDFVMTQTDEELMGIDGLAGTVMVTILPMLDGNYRYHNVAHVAGDRYPANPKIRARFDRLAELFLDKGL